MNITPEIFTQQCKRRFGLANPERMNMEHWEWMVRRGEDPYHVRKEFSLERETLDDGPDWCFDRFGMSRTPMPDGRIICIGGEHEDFYDPDYCIYNEVIVLRPAAGTVEVTPDSGEVEIYGYPETVFPPTDFHSATLVGDAIYLIGRLGYHGTRTQDITPVFKVDTRNYTIAEVKTTGECPGWIYELRASYDAHQHAITVHGGNRYDENSASESANCLWYRLNLVNLHWGAVAGTRESPRYELVVTSDSDPGVDDPAPENFRPDGVPHTWLPKERHVFPTYRIDVNGVCMRFDCLMSCVEVSIEGELPEVTVERVLSEIVANLTASTGVKWKAMEHPEK